MLSCLFLKDFFIAMESNNVFRECNDNLFFYLFPLKIVFSFFWLMATCLKHCFKNVGWWLFVLTYWQGMTLIVIHLEGENLRMFSGESSSLRELMGHVKCTDFHKVWQGMKEWFLDFSTLLWWRPLTLYFCISNLCQNHSVIFSSHFENSLLMAIFIVGMRRKMKKRLSNRHGGV